MLDRTATDWQALAGQLDIEGRAFINGRFVDALSGATVTSRGVSASLTDASRIFKQLKPQVEEKLKGFNP